MNIAILGVKQVPATAGADRVVEKLLENFSSTNHYWVYVRSDGESTTLDRENVSMIPIWAPRGKHIGAFVFFLLCSCHFLLKGRYDLAHIHNSDFGIFTLLVRLKPGIPVLCTFHGDPYVRQKWGRFARLYLHLSERFFVEFANRITSVSKFKSDSYGIFRRRRISYIPNGVDLDECGGTEELPDPISELNDYLFFACGRLDSTKGLHTLLNAFSQITSTSKLLVVGDFSHDPAYSEVVNHQMSKDSRVIPYRALLPRDQLLQLLARCRLFVFPSEYEAMSMMLLEAISCKAPTICSDIPPNLEVVGESYPYSYKVSDSNELKEKLQRALEEHDWRHITGTLHARCTKKFSWKNIAGSYEQLYAEMMRQ